MHIQSILALTDLSDRGNRAVHRAALIAAHHRALLKIMYAPGDLSGEAHTHAASGIAKLAAGICTRFGILVKKVCDTSGLLDAVADEARWVDLLVVGSHRERSAAALLAGQPAERLFRAVASPVLVAHLDVLRTYRRILVAVDFTPESRQLARFACSLDSEADVELFHALSTMHDGKLRYADVSEQAIKAYRHECALQARERMLWLTDSNTARRNRVWSAIGRGDAARQAVVQQQHANAELLVVGKRRVSAVADFFFGSVAQRVLQWSSGDILLVPHDLRIEAATHAVPGAGVPSQRSRPNLAQPERRAA